MWCRALLIVAAISYLVCVLILSGMRKEDLDLNTLQKLKRHNVNIDDINHENIRQDCSSKDTLHIPERTKQVEIYYQNETTITEYSEPPTTPAIQTVIKYFLELQKPPYSYPYGTIAPQNKSENVLDNSALLDHIIRKRVKADREPIIEVEQMRHNIPTEINTIKRDTSEANMDYLLKAFEMFGKYTPSREATNAATRVSFVETTHSTKCNVPVTTPEAKFTIEDSPKDIQYINHLFADLIAKSKIITSTPIPTTTQNKYFDNISKQIEIFLRNQPITEKNRDKDNDFRRYNSDVNNVNTQGVYPTAAANYELRNYMENRKILAQKFTQKHFENDKGSLRNDTLRHIDHLLGLDNSLPNTYSSNNNIVTTTNMPNIQEYLKQFGFNQAEEIKEKTITSYNENGKHIISTDIIKEIADKVKTLVLKDLQNEVATTTTTSTSTTTTTEKITITTPKQEQKNAQAVAEAMKLFMELFQQLQSTTEGTAKPIITTYSNAGTMKIQQAYKEPLKVMFPPIISLENPYDIKKLHNEMVPILFNQHLSVITPIPLTILAQDTVNNITPMPVHVLVPDTVNKITQFNIYNKHNQIPAITLQTNSHVIPPLGIQLPNSFNPINQNIVVTTKKSFDHFEDQQNSYNFRNNQHNYKNDYNQEIDAKYFNLAKRLRDHDMSVREKSRPTYDDDYRLKSNERVKDDLIPKTNRETDEFRPQNRERPNLNNDYEKIKFTGKPSVPYYRIGEDDRAHDRNENIKKFHERLEQADDWKQDPRDYRGNKNCCKISERQLLPLKGAKYSNFDDTHFRNFLKTQQKVNNMLERMLATKTKPDDGPRSVEVP